MQQFSLFPRREGVMHMLSTLQTSYLIARLCEECWGRWGEYFVVQQFRLCLFQFHGKNGSTKSPLKWLVIGWWMDSYFFKRSSEQTRGDFFSSLHWFFFNNSVGMRAVLVSFSLFFSSHYTLGQLAIFCPLIQFSLSWKKVEILAKIVILSQCASLIFSLLLLLLMVFVRIWDDILNQILEHGMKFLQIFGWL